jgi:excisionase family DNA binding protein
MVQKLRRMFTMRKVEFVTTKQAAEMLSVSITTICQMLHNGKLKGIKIGKEGKSSNWRINKKSLEDYIAKAI